MARGPNGIIFVGTTTVGKVYALVPQSRDRKARVVTIATGLRMPNGVAYRDGALYVGELTRVIRFDDIARRLNDPPTPVVVRDGFPDKAWHGWKVIRFGPDGNLYVPIGAPCNVCEPGHPFAALHRMKPDGSGLETVARGIRNTVGYDWDSRTGDLWFTDNGRDEMGDDVPPDELNHAPKAGLHFGFPYCHGKDIADPRFGKEGACETYTPPAIALGPHVASLGMRFYTGRQFPAAYHGDIFIAEHGSWNRSAKIGYRISRVRIVDGRAETYATFAEGWLLPGEKVWGRPVDVEVTDDGSLLVSDDYGGAVYRIRYGA
jgi:glucose/arabinose dehydrogenase